MQEVRDLLKTLCDLSQSAEPVDINCAVDLVIGVVDAAASDGVLDTNEDQSALAILDRLLRQVDVERMHPRVLLAFMMETHRVRRSLQSLDGFKERAWQQLGKTYTPEKVRALRSNLGMPVPSCAAGTYANAVCMPELKLDLVKDATQKLQRDFERHINDQVCAALQRQPLLESKPRHVLMLKPDPHSLSPFWSAPWAFPENHTNDDGEEIVVEGVETDEGVAVSQEVFDQLKEAKRRYIDELPGIKLLDEPPPFYMTASVASRSMGRVSTRSKGNRES